METEGVSRRNRAGTIKYQLSCLASRAIAASTVASPSPSSSPMPPINQSRGLPSSLMSVIHYMTACFLSISSLSIMSFIYFMAKFNRVEHLYLQAYVITSELIISIMYTISSKWLNES
eukprot:TRINITY_DN9078_c0_g2_i1.p1 TRINITY_DN9078_c0_g2~~TRINITY_DN9078_c0_g2_i1.p1  ORF type:complete len:118 (-),score=25.61 TRINITY_DN9078_c0_g2_i1:244-597(-)